MRNAREFVEEYRKKGYPDDRIRIIASMRPEPLRSEALKILDESKAEAPEIKPELKKAKDPESLALETPVQDTQEVEVEVPAEASPIEDSRVNDSDEREELNALRAQLSDVRKEREEVAALLKRTAAEVDRLRSENAEAAELRARIAELQSVHDELEVTRSQRKEVTAAKADIEGKLADLKGKLKQKETLLVEKDKILADLQEQVKRERETREEHESLAARAESELNEAQEAISTLRKDDEARLQQLEKAQDEMTAARAEAKSLRRQMDANEQAVSTLQEKVSARESELESLREHFDREAKDLNKRAEQELWMIQRRMNRLRRMAGIGAAAAACLLVVLGLGYIGKASQNSQLRAQINAQPNVEVQTTKVQLPAQSPNLAPQHTIFQTPARSETQAVPLNVTSGNATQTTVQERVVITPPVVEQPKVAKTYTVVKDDSLWDISVKIFGKGEHWKKIADANNIDRLNPRLQPGMVLKIPELNQ